MIRNDTDYALRMLVHLAEQAPRGLPTSELSSRLGVPHGFAQKILRRLAAAGMLEARLGRSGGFHLVRRSGEVSLMDVIAAVQGPLLLNRCLGDPTACTRQPSCTISAHLRVFQDTMDAFLRSTKLSSIAGDVPDSPSRGTTARQHLGKGKSHVSKTSNRRNQK